MEDTIASMKMLLRYGSLALLAPSFLGSTYAQTAAPALAPQMAVGLDLLSDTHGVHADPYFRRMIADLRASWLPLVQATSKRPEAQEETILRLTIAPDGRLLAMRVESSASDAALGQAAWTAVRDTSYLPLPGGMNGRNFDLRVHFVVGEPRPHLSPVDAPWI